MTKAISSYPESEKKNVIARRIRANTGGLGYWAAVDAQIKRGKVKEANPETALEEALDKTADG